MKIKYDSTNNAPTVHMNCESHHKSPHKARTFLLTFFSHCQDPRPQFQASFHMIATSLKPFFSEWLQVSKYADIFQVSKYADIFLRLRHQQLSKTSVYNRLALMTELHSSGSH